MQTLNETPLIPIRARLEENEQQIERAMGNSVDFLKRPFTISNQSRRIPGVCYFLDGMADSEMVHTIVRSIVSLNDDFPAVDSEASTLADKLREEVFASHDVKLITDMNKGFQAVFDGETLVLIDGCETALVVSTRGWAQRSVEEPATETVVRGPRDGFTENIRTNTAHVRRRIKDQNLRFESMQVGTKSRTEVEIAYIVGLAKENLVEEIKSRIQMIKIDGIMESGYIEELINDAPLSPFLTIQSTERPDRVAASLLEGRVAVFVDNTPFVLIAPVAFWQFLQSADDYYSRYWIGTFYRFIRYIALLISLLLPSAYVMLVTFHQEMIPTQLVLTIASGLEVVPFPVLLEALIMEMAFELMREAGLRMPKPIGQAVSIVGSLIIGQAAVQAGLVSPFMVIIVAVTGISSFVIPSYGTSLAVRILRFPLLIASGTLGLLGFVTVFSLIILHALSIRSFGESYFSPATPFVPSEQKDILFRPPWWSMFQRPQLAEDHDRLGSGSKPEPPANRGGGNKGGGGASWED